MENFFENFREFFREIKSRKNQSFDRKTYFC
jgi:hypothetical protein